MNSLPKLFIIALRSKEYPTLPAFANHAVACARKNSGCDVVALSNYQDEGWDDVSPFLNGVNRATQFILKNNDGVIPREAYPMFRWFIIAEYLSTYGITGPIVSLDWDTLCFGELIPHFQKCGRVGYHYGSSFDRERSKEYTAPVVVWDTSVIHCFTYLVAGVLKSWPPALTNDHGGFAGGGDMVWWNQLGNICRYRVATVSDELDGQLFDANIILDADRYEHDGCMGKKVVMQNGMPHFVRKDGTLIKALVIHCFMAWKSKTSELIG